MKSEFLIKEQLDMKKRVLDTGMDFSGVIAEEEVIKDLKIQVDILEWVLGK